MKEETDKIEQAFEAAPIGNALSYDADVVVAGGGVIGLSIARALAKKGRIPLVLEALDYLGSVTTSRNSGVIHAGLYYKKDSLKARLCLEGREKLYDFCKARGVGHRRCGKLVVANGPAELAQLEALFVHAQANGVDDLKLLNAAEARHLEPEIRADAAILSPSSGIVDQHELILALEGEIEAYGGMIVRLAPVISGAWCSNGVDLNIGGENPTHLTCRAFINAAGLGAQTLARAISGQKNFAIPDLHYAKGQYFRYAGKNPFNRLIYPLHSEASQGMHAGFDLGGQLRFGPDVCWVDQPDYKPDASKKALFMKAVAAYWPRIAQEGEKLTPDYAGVRPKLVAEGEKAGDFSILGPQDHGMANMVHLFGIESPGLTASLAVGDYAAGLLRRDAPTMA